MDDEDSLIRGRQNDMRGNEMKPDYYDEFQCIADACSLTCCQEWKIAVDRKTAAAFGTLYIYYAAALRLAPEQKLSAYRTGDKILPF